MLFQSQVLESGHSIFPLQLKNSLVKHDYTFKDITTRHECSLRGINKLICNHPIMLVRTLVIILKLTLSKQIGRYSWIFEALHFLGRILITPNSSYKLVGYHCENPQTRLVNHPLLLSRKSGRTLPENHPDQELYYDPFGKQPCEPHP
jgi:hypothetical protein